MTTTDRAAAADVLGRAMIAELSGCADPFRSPRPLTGEPARPRRPEGPHGPDAPHGAHR
ncbi:hypothetical protein ABZ871_22715 [Streptomyces populi]